MLNVFSKTVGLDERIVFLKERFETVFGSHLSSVLLYGSACGSHWHQDYSDINLAIEFRGEDIDVLDWATGLKKDFERFRIEALWFEEGGISRAADVFPIELLDMKTRSRVLLGHNPVENVIVYKPDLRLACERFGREKLLTLRSHYQRNVGNEAALRTILLRSTPGWSAVFQAVLYICDLPISEHAKERAEAVGERLQFDSSPFQALFEWRSLPKSGDLVFLMQLYRSYLRAIKGFTVAIDQWEENV